jgi:general secretion pathway protein A
MYTSFYKLNIKPFQISSDPDFMWLGEKHKEALATLKYGILDNKGFLLLTGDVGTGKTTLINSLIQSLSDDIICISVSDPSLSILDFFNYIAGSFGIDREFVSKGAFLARFRKFLFEAHEKNKKVLLIIDEAQLLTQELLEEIRLLSNIEKTFTKLINIFFVGQNEFNEILNQEQNRAVRQRLTLNYNIDPLTAGETDEYIKYRLTVAGATQTIFEPSAVQEVFRYSGGFPRRINVICDHALLSGYVKDCEIINAGIVQDCANDLKIPTHVRKREINRVAQYYPEPIPHIHSQSVSLAPEIPEEKKKRIGNLFPKIAMLFLFLVICWLMLFPVNFQKLIPGANRRVDFFKQTDLSTDTAAHIEKKLDHFEKTVDPSENLKQMKNTPEIIQADDNKRDTKRPLREAAPLHNGMDSLQEDNKKIKVKGPLFQDELEKIPEEKGFSEDEIRYPTLSVAPTASIKEEDLNPSGQYGEIRKKILSLPEQNVIIRFEFNTNDFTEEGFGILKDYADVLIMHPDTKIMIKGYTDSDGNEEYNVKLSEFRANITRSFLLGRGVTLNQIGIKGLGSKSPIESNRTSWGRMMNRRVEIEIVK